MSVRLVICACVCLLLSACFLRPYRMDVQQGNYLDRETIAKLKPGMTRAQVRFILGTPLIADPFNPNRWDYLYYNRPGRRIQDVRRLTLYFEDEKLKRAYADAAVTPTEADIAAAASSRVLPGAPQEPTGAPFPAAEPDQTTEPPRPAPPPTRSTSSPSRSPVPPGRGMGGN
jgi:outer membrane protein assembly factor BamE